MGRIEVTYLVWFSKMEITIEKGSNAEVAKIIHPESCFDREYEAKQALRKHYQNIRDIAQQNVKKAFSVKAKR